jgi:hypothetical protein
MTSTLLVCAALSVTLAPLMMSFIWPLKLMAFGSIMSLRQLVTLASIGLKMDAVRAPQFLCLDIIRGKYTALTQCRPVQVYRDNNRDEIIDMQEDSIYEGIFGINIHRAHSQFEVQTVGKYSAGCQVIQRSSDFDVLINACEKQVNAYRRIKWKKQQKQ